MYTGSLRMQWNRANGCAVICRCRGTALPAENTAGVLTIHQHTGKWHLGKSEVVGLTGNGMFAYAADLAWQGFVVLAPDSLYFEERIPEPLSELLIRFRVPDASKLETGEYL